MTKISYTAYECPKCHAELIGYGLVSTSYPGYSGPLHPEVAKIWQSVVEIYPLRYSDTFFVDPRTELYVSLYQCEMCSCVFLPNAAWKRKLKSNALTKKQKTYFEEQKEQGRIRKSLPLWGELVDGEALAFGSGLTFDQYIRAVDGRHWSDELTEKLLRIGALIEMNHHRRPVRKLVDNWSGGPPFYQWSDWDRDIIIALSFSRASLFPTPDYLDMRRKFSEGLSVIDKTWLSEEQLQALARVEDYDGKSVVKETRTALSNREKENIDNLLGLLRQSNFDLVIRSELYRMLEMYDECIAELELLDRGCFIDQSTIDAIGDAAKRGCPFVTLLGKDRLTSCSGEVHSLQNAEIDLSAEDLSSLNSIRYQMGLERGNKSDALLEHEKQ